MSPRPTGRAPSC